MPYSDRYRQKVYQRNWIAARRAEYFKDKKCAKCGSTENLELDHIDPNYKWRHSIWSYSLERREEELAKCQVLCHDCHLEKSITDMENLRKHGTISAYIRYHCRCDKCVIYKNDHPNELRIYLENCGNLNYTTKHIKELLDDTEGTTADSEAEARKTHEWELVPALSE